MLHIEQSLQTFEMKLGQTFVADMVPTTVNLQPRVAAASMVFAFTVANELHHREQARRRTSI